MKIRVKGALYELPTELTFGEQMEIQQAFGDLNQGSLGLGTIWIAVRRVHPKTKLEDLADATVEVVEDDEDALPPTSETGSEAAGESGAVTGLANIGIPRSAS